MNTPACRLQHKRTLEALRRYAVCSTVARMLQSNCLLLAGLLCVMSTGCGYMSQGQNVEGVRLYQQGNYQAALEKFQTAVDRDPKNADAYYNLAATHHRMAKHTGDLQQYQQAESLYNQCLDYNPDHLDCYRGLAVLLVETNRADRSVVLLQRWAEQSPTLAAPKVELARIYEEFGDMEQAKQRLRDALVLSPDDARALAALGRLHEQAGNTAQALSVYQRSLAQNQFQPLVAERVASLQAAITGDPILTPPNGNRLVVTPGGAVQ